jgi:hypothetical protein
MEGDLVFMLYPSFWKTGNIRCLFTIILSAAKSDFLKVDIEKPFSVISSRRNDKALVKIQVITQPADRG